MTNTTERPPSGPERTLTLTDFLLARIAEDEEAAELVRQDEHPPTRDGSYLGCVNQGGYETCTITSGRVLAECEAKRRIVALHSTHAPAFCDICSRLNRDMDGFEDERPYPCATLAALALPYADHPDYRPEWRP